MVKPGCLSVRDFPYPNADLARKPTFGLKPGRATGPDGPAALQARDGL